MTRGMLLATTALLAIPFLAEAKEPLVFVPTPAPADDAAKRAVVASPGVTVDGAEVALGYHTLLRTGQKVG